MRPPHPPERTQSLVPPPSHDEPKPPAQPARPPALGQQCACLPLPCATQRATDSHPRVRTTQGNSQPCLQWVFPIYVRARY